MEKVEILKDMVTEINGWDGTFEDLDFYDNDEEFFNTFYYNRPMEVARAIQFGRYNINDDYVLINNLGNIESYSEYEIDELILEYEEEIIETYKELVEDNMIEDYSGYLEMFD